MNDDIVFQISSGKCGVISQECFLSNVVLLDDWADLLGGIIFFLIEEVLVVGEKKEK